MTRGEHWLTTSDADIVRAELERRTRVICRLEAVAYAALVTPPTLRPESRLRDALHQVVREACEELGIPNALERRGRRAS